MFRDWGPLTPAFSQWGRGEKRALAPQRKTLTDPLAAAVLTTCDIIAVRAYDDIIVLNVLNPHHRSKTSAVEVTGCSA